MLVQLVPPGVASKVQVLIHECKMTTESILHMTRVNDAQLASTALLFGMKINRYSDTVRAYELAKEIQALLNQFFRQFPPLNPPLPLPARHD
jgi:hypothetical protein